MSEHYHPEHLNDDHLWGRYHVEVQQLEMWQRRAERSLEELMQRGLIQEPVEE